MTTFEAINRARRKTHAVPGFTFLELILVVAILGTLMAVVGSKIRDYQARVKVGTARMGLRTLQEAIDFYKTETDQYPTTLTDLVRKPENVKNWTTPFISDKKALTDPWGNKYKYELSPEGAEHPYELFSLGDKGRAASRDQWISVWDAK